MSQYDSLKNSDGLGLDGAYGDAAVLGSAPPPLALPAATDKPVAATTLNDPIFAGAFVLHLLVIVFLAFAWGIRAINSDALLPADDGARPVLDFNAAVLSRVLCIACVVGGASSVLFLGLLQRNASTLVATALYGSLAVQAVVCCAMFAVSALFGVLLLIPLALSALFVYYARRRIPFASAHVELAVDAVRAFPSTYLFALAMVFAQFVWVMLWQLAAFGLENQVDASSRRGSTGGAMVFFALISLFWGAQLLSYIAQFVVASVVGEWWYSMQPLDPVRKSVRRAFTSSFGSLSLGALVIAVLEAARQAARSAERAARERHNNAAAVLACIGACVLSCVEGLAQFFTTWAVVMIALTGTDFKAGGVAAFNLFQARGFTLVINDDLVGPALRIACFLPAVASALCGGALSYLGSPSLSPIDRGTLAGVAAFLSFVVGFAMASVLSGVLAAAVRSIFVCFALNPSALGVTHPEALNKLVAAWNASFPAVLQDCGYAYHFGGGGAAAPNGAYSSPAPMI